MTDVTTATYNKIAEKYAARRNANFWEWEKFDFISLLRGKEVLDAGCGLGIESWYFFSNGLTVTGIDKVRTHAFDSKRERSRCKIP